jgi:hypothetical protein
MRPEESLLLTFYSMVTAPLHGERRGCDLFRVACERDFEGIVAKWSRGTYRSDGGATSCLKTKNLDYSQMPNRHELFELRQFHQRRARVASLPPPGAPLKDGAELRTTIRQSSRSLVLSAVSTRSVPQELLQC